MKLTDRDSNLSNVQRDVWELRTEERALAKALEQLPLKIALILNYRMIEHRTLQQIADFMGVSHERIRQKEARGIRMLRHPKRRKYLMRWRFNPESKLIKKVFELWT